MSRRAKQLLMACLVPILILIGMCFTPVYTLLQGDEIILQTVPVDPTDIFRGDYVTLQYEAEQVPKQLVDKEVVQAVEHGEFNLRVYVHLQEKVGIHSPVKVTLNKPKKGIFLKGKIVYIGTNNEQEQVVYIQYSLDKYFLEDNTGHEWEEASAKGEILARVKVNNGYAYLVSLKKKE